MGAESVVRDKNEIFVMVFSPASWEREIAVGSVQGAPVVPTTKTVG
jgi:hypothetical protein